MVTPTSSLYQINSPTGPAGFFGAPYAASTTTNFYVWLSHGEIVVMGGDTTRAGADGVTCFVAMATDGRLCYVPCDMTATKGGLFVRL